MNEIETFLKRFGIDEEDALKALIGAFSPLQPPALRQNWTMSKRYGHSAPTTQQIWKLFSDANFRCGKCGSQRRITLDHIDGDPTNHAIENLQVLCAECNRGQNQKATRNHNHQLRIYRAALELFDQSGAFPTDRQIRERAGISDIGGATYLVRYIKTRLCDGPLPPVRNGACLLPAHNDGPPPDDAAA